MTMDDFDELPTEEKLRVLFHQGQYVESVKEGHTSYALYALSYFWVEFEFNGPMTKIECIVAFVYGPSLDRYRDLEI